MPDVVSISIVTIVEGQTFLRDAFEPRKLDRRVEPKLASLCVALLKRSLPREEVEGVGATRLDLGVVNSCALEDLVDCMK